jgi:hypothetical protein
MSFSVAGIVARRDAELVERDATSTFYSSSGSSASAATATRSVTVATYFSPSIVATMQGGDPGTI